MLARPLLAFLLLAGALAVLAPTATGQTSGDSPYAEIPDVPVVTIPLPVVTLRGTVTGRGVVAVSRLLVRAQRGSVVRVACRGEGCPFARSKRLMLTSALRLKRLERRLRPGMTLTLRIGRPGQLGKFVRYRVRRGAAPDRFDACLDPVTRKVRGCFTG